MNNSAYFNNALHDMVFENACGAAIRRLADKSLPISYIHRELDYPISFERVQAYVWRYYLDNKTLLYPDNKLEYKEENGFLYINEPKITKTYVKEQGPYGKITYRQVIVENSDTTYSSGNISVNKNRIKYTACDFGIIKTNNPREFDKLLDRLDTDDKAYVKDMPWENRVVYHFMNERMISILNAIEKK